MQHFKSVYFSDHPGSTAKRRNVKLAFGPDDAGLFAAIKPLSSEDIRSLLGYSTFADLIARAEADRTSLNAYCLRLLRDTTTSHQDDVQLRLLQPDSVYPGRVDPIQATFRGGVAEPLHAWYPYLEGYSPEYVQHVLNSYAPTATRVLDPFAGTGTTPLTAARRGHRGFYCELNPLLQFLVDAKATVLTMPGADRARLATRLSTFAADLPSLLAPHAADTRLAESYSQTFADSQFFPPPTLNACLKLRSWIDAIACTEPLAAALATVATVSTLIPCSHLIRRGDLRFRKGPERSAIKTDLPHEVANRLQAMLQDVTRISSIDHRPLLVSGDAKLLNRVADLQIDAIVTSPPYLNGTNYYRNTKIELWFLRALLSGRDLSTFRRQTVTAGINDVTAHSDCLPVSEHVCKLGLVLAERAYDRRIPKMVLSYFSDMKQVIDGLLLHVSPSAPLVIDIGDSAYAGVHVDTPAILSDLLHSAGWRVRDEITLRQRLSRNGQPLRQVILFATAPPKKRPMARTTSPWRPKWEGFKRSLPHQRGDFAKRNWGSSLHSLCSYQGKMKPSLAHHLVKTFTSPGGRLLDPFGGVGTIPFEAAMHGVTAWCFDISPATIPVAIAKLHPAADEAGVALIAQIGSFISSHRPTQEEHREAASIRFNGPLPSYFHPKTFAEILLARRFFRQNRVSTPTEALVFSCLLHVLHGNRPYALSRRSHPITPFAPTGVAEYRSLTEKVTEKYVRSLAADRSADFVVGSAMLQDATTLWPSEVEDLDAIITSPPFYDSTRFYLANWMRLWFAGWGASDFKQRPHSFVDERQKKDFKVYEPVIRQSRERLKPGGVCVLHLGKSRKCDMAHELSRVARPWFSNIDGFAESVAHCESHGIRDKGTVVEHTYLVMS